MATIFISYARSDGQVYAEDLANRLRGKGHQVLIDLVFSAGIDWEKEIKKNIKKSLLVVVLVTEESNASDWVFKEIKLTQRLHKRIVPIQLGRTPLPPHLRDIQAITNPDLDHVLAELTDIIWKELINHVIRYSVFTAVGLLSLAVVLFLLAAFLDDSEPDTTSERVQTRAPTLTFTFPPSACPEDNLCELMPLSQIAGGKPFNFIGTAGNLSTTFTPECAYSGNLGLKFQYSFLEGGYGGWGIHWRTTPNHAINISRFRTITFMVRSLSEKGGFQVGLKDANGIENKVELSDLLPEEIIRTNWRQVIVPLEYFDAVNTQSIDNVNFGFNSAHADGEICIDDLVFQ